MLVKALAATLLAYVVFGAALFGAAGTVHVPAFWAYLALMVILSLLVLILLYRRSPDLIAERMRPGEGEQDRISILAMKLLLPSSFIIAGLDVGRYHFSDVVAMPVQVVGFAAVVIGFAIVTWAMVENRFFSSAVRIQADRGQRVISAGPYAFVRHPGYTGGLLFLLGSGFALGSWMSLAPMFILVVLIVRRTLLEDKMLQRELEGYSEYSQRVRFRLIPGVW